MLNYGYTIIFFTDADQGEKMAACFSSLILVIINLE